MHRRALLIAGLLALMAPAVAQTAAPRLDTPLAAVKRLYDPKIKDAQRPFSKKLKTLYAEAVKTSKRLKEAVAGLDFDPLTSSQDADDDYRKSLKFSVEPRGAGNAVVVVKLLVFKGQPETTLFYDVTLEGEEWKIDDISNPAKTDGWRWSTLLIAGAKGQ